MKITTASIFSFFIASALHAMPPAPGLIEQLGREGRLDALIERQNDAQTRGMDRPGRSDMKILDRDEANETILNVVCILVDFDDNEANVNAASVEHFQEMLFSEGEYPTGSMRDWYLENSYGNVDIVGQAYGWYRMPQDYAYYVDGEQGHGRNFPRNGMGLARDALIAANEDIDYNEYDNNDNNVAEGVLIVHAGLGAEQTGSDDMIWSHSWVVPRELALDGVRFRTYAMEPENGKIGVFGHELGHSLFELPDLYDTAYNSAGVGNWSMMSGGSWGGGGDRPVHFDAWSKYKVGFISPNPMIEDRAGLVQQPVQRVDDVMMAWRNGEWGSEYFLIENRPRIGFDESLPSGGLLIWHCDESEENNAHPWWPGQGNRHNIVALEQADGHYHLEQNANGGDSGDPWPGVTWNNLFSSNSVPDSKDYDGEPTMVSLFNFEPADSEAIRYDLLITREPRPVIPDIFLLERIPQDHIFPDPDVQEDSTDEITMLLHNLRWTGSSIERGSELPGNLRNYNSVIYVESWRDGDDPAPGLSQDEQRNLITFLLGGGKLILIGPDVARNLSQDNLLWPYLHAEFVSDGVSRDDGNLRRLTANPESRIAGQNFVYRQHSASDHFVDQVAPEEDAIALFTGLGGDSRGVMYIADEGYRVILQPFLFGGLVDWGGSKEELLRDYLEFFHFTITGVEKAASQPITNGFRLTGAYPNPFNQSLNLSWEGAIAGTWVDIFDVTGRKVGRFGLNAGSGVKSWRPAGLGSGSYIILPGLPGADAIRVNYLP